MKDTIKSGVLTMGAEEVPIVFDCQGNDLISIIHNPENSSKTGVLIVVGGPQYRAGSHRQFILLARVLSQHGIPVMRFDYRGMGDSEGERRSFFEVDDDIKTALDAFFQYCPKLDQVAIWGLCDAASAALFYAYQDDRVRGLVLLNPWVFTEEGAAKTYLKHYYWQRIFSKDFWRKIFLLQFNYRQSFVSLFSTFLKMYKPKEPGSTSSNSNESEQLALIDEDLPLPIRMRECLQRFSYPVLFILSGRDLTADEFREAVKSDDIWQELFKQQHITRIELPKADHTFSSAQWRDEVATATLNWLREKIQ